jgi:hypothetical protein
VTKRVEFTKEDLIIPVLQVGHIFADANLFRKAVKQANILKGKDLEFKRNKTKKNHSSLQRQKVQVQGLWKKVSG